MEEKGLSGFISKYAKILVVLAVIFGATSGTLGKAITAPSIAIGFWRLTMGLPFFGIPVFIKDRGELPGLIKGEKEGSKGLYMACLAGVFLFCHFTCWFNAVKMTNIASASVLGALHPLVVLAISLVIYKKRIGIKAIIGIIVAIIGACLTAGLNYSQFAAGHLLGDVMALLAAMFLGIYFAIGEKAREKLSGRIYVFALFSVCWVCFLMAMIVTKTPFFAYPAKDFLLLVVMTILCQIGAHAVFNLCLGHVDSVFVSTWETGETVFAILISFIFLNQVPNSWELAGCALVVCGLLYYNRHASDKV